MFTRIALQQLPSGEFRASAPDLPGCSVTDDAADTAFARVRLAIEGTLADLMLAFVPIPEPRPPAAWQGDPRFAGARWFEVHINLGHIHALAKHQKEHARGGQ